MQFQEINKELWQDTMKDEQNVFFADVLFHEIIKRTYKADCTYFAVIDSKNIIQIALPIFHRSKDASLLTHFFYQHIYIHSDISERKKIEGMNLLVESLIKKFDKIDLKLNPEFNDIRAFTWNGFDNQTYYTYLIDLNKKLNYSENISRQIKKYKLTHTVEHVVDLKISEGIFEQHLIDMNKNGIPKKELSAIRSWLTYLSEQGLLKVFALRDDNNEINGSAIYIVHSTRAYLISIMSKNTAQVLLYDEVFNFMKEHAVFCIDLLGANLQNIAVYKSQFDANLQSYIIVSYRKNKNWESLKLGLKKKIKSILNK